MGRYGPGRRLEECAARLLEPAHAVAKRARDTMMTMTKIDIAGIEAARRGEVTDA